MVKRLDDLIPERGAGGFTVRFPRGGFVFIGWSSPKLLIRFLDFMARALDDVEGEK